jgi:hypothetical protein
MKVKILRLLEYSGELEDLVNDQLRWGVSDSRTWGRPGHEITIRSAVLLPNFDNSDYTNLIPKKDTL